VTRRYWRSVGGSSRMSGLSEDSAGRLGVAA
jgi:hypothetical protein